MTPAVSSGIRVTSKSAEHGLYLTRNNLLVDTQKGQPRPDDSELIEPMTREQIEGLRKYTVEEMSQRAVRRDDRVFSSTALLDSRIPGHGAELALVLGHGITEDRDHVPPISNPHGMSIEWGRIPAGGSIGRHLLHEKQVMIVFSGAVEITQNEGDAELSQTVNAQDLYSFPADSWRSIRNTSSQPAEFVLMTAGDHKKRIQWPDEVRNAAAKLGYAIDHNGYVAPLALLPQKVKKAFAQ